MLKRLAVACATALTTLVVTAAPAHAANWVFSDGFENNPLGRWSFSGTSTAHGNFDGTNGTPHAGLEYADVYLFDTGWSAVGRNVHLTPASAHSTVCSATVWIQTNVIGGTEVNLEIIDPATWTYISLRKVSVPLANYAWQKFSFNSWTANSSKDDVVLRMAVLSKGDYEGVKIDDVIVQCTN